MMLLLHLALTLTLLQAAPPQPAATRDPAPLTEELWDAARAGDEARVTAALEKGADVNARNRYGASALTFAADKGHARIVRLLLDRGADLHAQDTFYKMRPLDMAIMNGHAAVAVLLLERGSPGAGAALMAGIRREDLTLIQAALASADIKAENIPPALAAAKRSGNAAIVPLVEKKAATLAAADTAPAVNVEREALASYAGSYRNESSGLVLSVALDGDQLTVTPPGQPALLLVPTSPTTFRLPEAPGITLAFGGRGGTIERAVLTQNGQSQTLDRVATPPAAAAAPPPAHSADDPAKAPAASALARAPRTAPRPWPAFRGSNAAGNGDGQGAVTTWNVADGTNLRWKTDIPGIANASPIVWGDRVFVTTAASSAGDRTFRTGLYGDVAPVDDLSEHTWKIYALEKSSGRILWERVAFTGLPKVKRHTKATQANSTPVTDGTHVVALFGSIGLLAAWDIDGTPAWTADVGVLDSGWFFDPTYQWGHSSSPIIHEGKVIVQADRQKDSYIAAFDVRSGKQIWRTARDEISTWGTPAIFHADGRDQIVTNGTTIRAYDAQSGRLLWSLGPNSEITVATPVVGDELVFITGGYPPVRPIYAVTPAARGDITMPKDRTASDAVAWSNTAGTYIPTPIYYDGILYTVGNEGILTAYDAKSGERLYRTRVGGGGSFSASPVAADGRLYFASEDGDIIVTRAGRSYEELARNAMNDVIMSTPAISDGLIIIRTLGHVYGIGEKR
jgi:outer membrane protein assembly factor BamB